MCTPTPNFLAYIFLFVFFSIVAFFNNIEESKNSISSLSEKLVFYNEMWFKRILIFVSKNIPLISDQTPVLWPIRDTAELFLFSVENKKSLFAFILILLLNIFLLKKFQMCCVFTFCSWYAS